MFVPRENVGDIRMSWFASIRRFSYCTVITRALSFRRPALKRLGLCNAQLKADVRGCFGLPKPEAAWSHTRNVSAIG